MNLARFSSTKDGYTGNRWKLRVITDTRRIAYHFPSTLGTQPVQMWGECTENKPAPFAYRATYKHIFVKTDDNTDYIDRYYCKFCGYLDPYSAG